MSIIGEAATAKVTLPEPTAPYVKYDLNSSGNAIKATLTGFTNIPAYFMYVPNNDNSLNEIDIYSYSTISRIEDYAFKGNRYVIDFIIPSTVTYLGTNAFQAWYGAQNIYCYPTTPPTGTAGGGLDKHSGLKIYVPANSVNAYKDAWSLYSSYIYAMEE